MERVHEIQNKMKIKSYINATNIVSPLGTTTEENFEALLAGKTGISELEVFGNNALGSKIDSEGLSKMFSSIKYEKKYTKLEKLMIFSVKQLLKESSFEINGSTGLLVSTTKGNIDLLDEESTFQNKEKRVYLSEMGKIIQNYFGFSQPPIILSNACVSGIQAIGLAQRFISTGDFDSIIVVGGDLFSSFVYSGFESFQAISSNPCKPYSKNRTGITLGEACGSLLVTQTKTTGSVEILGSGTANDANHISGPSRTGEGLFKSIQSALGESGLSSDKIDFISAHGTATNYNDEMESIAFNRCDLSETPIHSLKGYYGHTLGAAGVIEAVIGIESLQKNNLIPSMGFDELGTSQPLNVITEPVEKELNCFLKTASGFGGTNTAVLFKKTDK